MSVKFGGKTDGKTVKFGEGSVLGLSGEKLEEEGKDLELSALAPGRGRKINVENGKLYSFMNTDTGRLLTVDGQTELRVFAEEGENMFSLRSEDGKKYLSADENGRLSFTDGKFAFNINLGNDYDRVQLKYLGGMCLLGDSDKGSDSAAAVVSYIGTDSDIRTGWYMTLYGDPLPMRVALVGDSITNGCCPDGTEPKAGCRGALAEMLIFEYGRVVFVGSTVASHGGDGTGGRRSSLSDPFLYRNDGHNGWVVTSQNGYAPANNYGIDTLIPNLMTKYQPDVICMMIGINDINQIGLTKVYEGKEEGVSYWERWKTLVNGILQRLQPNGRLIIGTYTPWASGKQWNVTVNARLKGINTFLASLVEEIKEQDGRISLADNFEYVMSCGPEGCSSDGIHLSPVGYGAMAESYYDEIVLVAGHVTDREVAPDTYAVETEINGKAKERGAGKIIIPIAAAAAFTAVAAATAIILKRRKK